MPKLVTLYRVVISCPSDAWDELAVAWETISKWNAENSDDQRIAFEAVTWQTHVAPYLDKDRRGQDKINEAIIKNADLLIAIFRARLGTPTGGHLSGTVEEIDEFMKAGKVAWVFFRAGLSESDLPAEGREQYRNLTAYKESIRDRSLYREFRTDEELSNRLSQDLGIHACELKKSFVPPALSRYAEETGRSYIPNYIPVEFELDDRNLFKVVECICDSLDEHSEIIASDYLNLREAKWRMYWCQRGLEHLKINFNASGRGIRIRRVFIIPERHLKQYPKLVAGLCELHSLAGVEPMVVAEKDVPEHLKNEFALFGDQYVDEVYYNFDASNVISRSIYWSKQKITAYKSKAAELIHYADPAWTRYRRPRAETFREVDEYAQKVLALASPPRSLKGRRPPAQN